MDTQTELHPWDRAARDAQIIEKHARGMKASTIARLHKLTPSRVRQILQVAGVWKSTKGEAA